MQQAPNASEYNARDLLIILDSRVQRHGSVLLGIEPVDIQH